jgi:signal transduction histidine kinase
MAALNQTVWVINSKRDTLQDLVSYICRYAESFFQSTPICCRFDVEDEIPTLSCDVGVRRNLFLAVKESLNNVLRHSAANEVTLRIHRQAGELMIQVEDNGIGFAPDQADAQRNGLSNMKERAADAGGSCRIFSLPGAGCRIEFRVPLNSSRRRSLWSWFAAKNGRANNLANPPPPPPLSSATAHEDETQA